ncbi:MAG: hypothetical protein ACI89X_000832 [Planctomycetota bacterium]|jgi:hypothetical protein
MARLRLNNLRARDVWILAAPLLAFAAILLHHAVVNVMLIEVKPSWRNPGWFSLRMGALLDQATVASDRTNLLATNLLRQDDADALNIYIPENSWDELSADLPASGWEWKNMLLGGEGSLVPAQLRLRGDYGIHFFFEKKSLKIRPRQEGLIRNRSHLILSKKRLFQQHFLYALGSKLDLLCPKATYTRIFKNHQYYGTSLNIEAIDELFLRRRGLMPGNIYVGENIENTVHRDVPGQLFANPYIWEKSAEYNRHAPDDFTELARALATLELPDRADRWSALRHQFDWDEVARFCAFTICCTRAHMNEGHNLKFYVDPLSGKMHPIVWDPLMFYGTQESATKPGAKEAFKQIEKCDLFTWTVNRFLHTFMEDPAFIGAVAKELAKIVDTGAIEEALAETEASFERARPFFELDALDVNLNQPQCGLSNPEATAGLARRNAAALRASLEEVSITWQGGQELNVSVRGFGGAQLASVELATEAPEVTAHISTFGSAVAAKRVLRRSPAGTWQATKPIRFNGGVTRRNIHTLDLNPVAYTVRFLADGVQIPISTPPTFANVFGDPVAAGSCKRGIVEASSVAADSNLLPRPSEANRTIGADGQTIHLTSDLFIPRHQTLVIAAGTTVRLDPGVSIVCHGSVSIRGSKANPVTFEPEDSTQPWGVFLVQGSAGTRVEISHVSMQGGSEAVRDGVYYSGMLSMHYVDDAVVQDSTFFANRFGDDGLRAASCTVRLERCKFHTCNSDGVDLDLCHGKVLDCQFSDNGNDALDLMSSQVTIKDCQFERSGDKGVSCGEDSKVSIDSCIFENNRIGIEAKDSSFAYVLGGRISGSLEFGIHAYAKNWRYNDGGHVEVRDTSLTNQNDASGDEHSHVWLVNSQSRGSINSSCLTWNEKVDWGDVHVLSDIAGVKVDETYEDNFVSRSDGWTSQSKGTRFHKSNNVLHAQNDHEPVSISRQIAQGKAPLRTIELLVGIRRGKSLEVILELADGTRQSATIAVAETENIKPHRIRCKSGIVSVHLRSEGPKCRLSIMKMRLW